ncbi:hypothetical protein [Microbacterium oxydans]|nr:hypothetical protein [Microbacterium oxydans]
MTNVHVTITITGDVPMAFLPKLFELASAAAPLPGHLTFQVDPQ